MLESDLSNPGQLKNPNGHVLIPKSFNLWRNSHMREENHVAYNLGTGTTGPGAEKLNNKQGAKATRTHFQHLDGQQSSCRLRFHSHLHMVGLHDGSSTSRWDGSEAEGVSQLSAVLMSAEARLQNIFSSDGDHHKVKALLCLDNIILDIIPHPFISNGGICPSSINSHPVLSYLYT
ncbi:hypothetical protein Cni_G17081 [Canna indica]|uniref:Uncharacterized protein n=1 Tax=Canna indica TaxID=4628 RepID=A0AAQ3KGF2_9LILI|nr:hypothetical protein Cni_G17081 [Canna indica]